MNEALGMNIFLGWRHDPAELPSIAAQAWDAGIRWLREPVAWSLAEKAPGNWDWSRLDLGLHVAARQGFQIIAILGGPPPWGTVRNPDKPDEQHSMPLLEPWRQYVRAIVERYREIVHCWEVGNEPNFQWFWRPEPNPREYATLLQATVETVKEVDPTALTVAMSTSGCDTAFIEAVFKAGGDRYTEAVSVHPYSSREGPEPKQPLGVEQTADLLHRYGLKPRIWLTELGWGTFHESEHGVTEEVQADYLVRGYTLALAQSSVEKVFWYCYRDNFEPLPPDFPAEWEYTRYYGIVRRDLTVKPAYTALRTLSRELAGLSFERRLEAPDSSEVLLFSNPERKVAVCWTTGAPRRVSLPLAGDAATTVTHQGVETKVPRSGPDGVEVVATSSPLFVRL